MMNWTQRTIVAHSASKWIPTLVNPVWMNQNYSQDLTVMRRWWKWYNVPMIKLDRGWIFLEPCPVNECAIWTAPEISSTNVGKENETGRYRKIQKKKNQTLCPWGKQAQARGGLAPLRRCPCISCNASHWSGGQESETAPQQCVLGSARQHSKECSFPSVDS